MTKMSVPGFSIIKKIGEGAMSEVFSAKDDSTRVVALKILRQFLKNDQACIERISKEAENLARLEDDRIVKLFDVVKSSDDRLVLVQEFVDGPNLEELLTRSETKRLPIIGATLVSEILLGLEEAHRQEIVHRDLKPENIMVNSKGRVKIADFGVAKNLESEELTVTGMIIGSPAFMSPEQVANEVVDQRSDIFSIGVILYRMATGELPFVGSNFASLIKKISEGVFVSPEKINPEIHPELARIICKALGNNKNKRYQKVYQFRYDLMSYLDSLGIAGPQKILRSFLSGDISIEKDISELLMKTIMVRAKHAIDEGDQGRGVLLVQQALSLDPENQQAQKLLSSMGRGSKRIVWLVSSVLSIMFIAAGIIFFMPTSKKAVAVAPKKVVAPLVEKKIVPISKKTISKVQPVIKKKKTTPKIKKVISTNIRFLIDPDVSVYLDDNLIPNAHDRKIALNPGKHHVMLVKKGFDPIKSFVDVPAGETTVINAQTRK